MYTIYDMLECLALHFGIKTLNSIAHMHILCIHTYTNTCARGSCFAQYTYVFMYVCLGLGMLVCTIYEYFGWLFQSFVYLAKWMCAFWTFSTIKETEKCAFNYIQLCEHRRNRKLDWNATYTNCRFVFYFDFFLSRLLLSLSLLLLFLGVLFPHAICTVWKKSSSSSHTT